MGTIHAKKRGTHLSELQSRDDHQHHAPKAEIQPIPVGQAGIGLSLQEFQQHGQIDCIPPPPCTATATKSRGAQPQTVTIPEPDASSRVPSPYTVTQPARCLP